MITVEDILAKSGDVILHAYDPSEYNPQKAREYYLRTRKLKGRHPAAVQPVKKGRHPAVVKAVPKKAGAKLVAPPHKKVYKKSAAQVHKEAAAHVAALTKKLEQLQTILAQLVKEAKARSGVVTPVKKTPAQVAKAAAAKNAPPVKLTAKQKADAAKRSKEAYAKEQKKPLSQQEAELTKKIADATQKIHDLKAEIAAAKKKAQKRTSSSVGARATNNK